MSTNNAKKVANWDEEVTDIVPKKVDSWDEEVSDEPVKKKASSEATSGVPTLLKPPTKESTLQSEQGGLDFSQTPSEILAKETPKKELDLSNIFYKAQKGQLQADLVDFAIPDQEPNKNTPDIDDLTLRTKVVRGLREQSKEKAQALKNGLEKSVVEGERLIEQYRNNPTPELKAEIEQRQQDFLLTQKAYNKEAFIQDAYEKRLVQSSDSIKRLANDKISDNFYAGVYQGLKGNTESWGEAKDLFLKSKAEQIEYAKKQNEIAPTKEGGLINQAGQMIGGVLPDIAVAIGFSLAGLPSVGATTVAVRQGAQQAAEDFSRAFNKAKITKMDFGGEMRLPTDDEAYDIATKSAGVGFGTGAIEGLFGTITGNVGGRIANRARTKVGKIVAEKALDTGIDATVAGTMQTGRNVFDRAQGLDTKLTEGVAENMLGEILLSAPINTVSGAKAVSKEKKNQRAKSIFESVVKSKDNLEELQKLKENIEVLTNQGLITKEDAVEITQKANDYARVVPTIPEEVKNKQDAADLIIERDELEVKKESVDKAFQKPIEERINAINDELVNVDNKENEIRSTDNNIPKQVESPQQEIKLTPIEVIAGKEQGDGGVAKVVQGDGQVEQAPKTKEEIADEIELKNEGKAEAPTKESVTERLNINNPFYQKVEDALVKLGLIEKYNPETGTGDVVGGYAQQTSDGGFSVGKMLFSQDGSISYFDGDVKVSFDKNGNVISENTKEAKQKAVSLEIEGKKQSIANLEKTRDSEAFKYKEVIETDVLGNKKKVKRLKTEQELKESTDKINAAIDKAKNEITELEQQYEKEPTKKEDGKPLSRGVQGVRIEGQAGKESAELRPEEEVALDIRSAKDIGDIQINDINSGNVVIGYHATPTGEIGTGKELGIHIGTEDVSNNIKKGRNSNKGDVKKVAFRVNKPLILGDMPSWSSVNVLNEMMRQKLLGIDKEKLREIRDSDLSEKEKQQRIIELAKEKGYDSFAYQNFDEGNGEFSYVLFDDSKLNDITPKEAKATPQAGSVVGGEVNFTEVEDKKIKDIATEANLKVGSYVRSVPTGKKNKFGNSINEYEATNPFTNEKITFKKQGDATDYVVKEIAKATTKSGREEIFKAVEQSLKETPQEVKASTPEKVQEEAKPLTKEKELLKQKKIEGTLFTEKESQDYQKEIESKYNDSDTPISKRFGQENEDIRQKLFNYDNPIAQKEVNGVDVRIAEGLVEGEPYLGKRRKTYLLYADGKIAGKFYSVNDAKKVVKFIEDNLVKTIASPQQKLQAPKIETNEKDKQAVGDNTSTESKGNLKDSKSPKSPKRKRVSKGASPRVKNALSIESGDLRHKVMQYFIGGGKINTSVFQKLFGKAGDATLNKAARSEANQRFGLWNNKKGLSINQLAHKLWEDNGGAYNESNPTDDVYREAVEEVVLRYNGTRAMIDELNNINMFTEETQSLTEEERFAMEEEKYYRNSLTDEEEALYDLNLAEEVWQSLTDEQKLALIKDQIEAEELVNQYDAIQGKKEAIESEIKANDERIGKIKKSLDDEAKKEQGNLFGGGMQAPKMFNTAEGLGTELKALERKNEALKSQLEELQPQEEVKNQAKIDFDNKLTETEKAIDVYKRLSENNDTSTRKEYKALPESIKRVLDNIVNIHQQLEQKKIITKKGNCP